MSRRVSLVWQSMLALLMLLMVVWALAHWLPPAYDFSVFFRPAVWYWLQGQSPYSVLDRLHNPPWLLLVLLPFTLIPESVGRALLLAFSAVVLVWGLRSFRRRRLAAMLVLVSFPCLGLFWNGQLEALSLLGIGLGSWAVRNRRPWVLSASLPLLLLKPQETALVILLLLWCARHWSRAEWLRVASLLIAVLIFSFAVFRFEWLRNLLSASDVYPGAWVNISWWWRALGGSWPGVAAVCSLSVAGLGLGLTMSRPLSPYTLALIVTAGILASPLVEGHHLVIPLALAWPWLLDRQPGLALPVYLLTLTPLVRLSGVQSANWLDFIFPVVLMASLLFFYREQPLEQTQRE